MRIFLAGGTGVAGRRLIPLLTKAGHEVTAVSRSDVKSAAIAAVGATPVRADRFSVDALRPHFGGMTPIINLATSVPPASRALMPGACKEMGRVRRKVSANLPEARARNSESCFASRTLRRRQRVLAAGAGDGSEGDGRHRSDRRTDSSPR